MANSNAERQARWRTHSAGDHGDCDPMRCADKLKAWCLNEDRLYAVALLAELESRGIDPKGFLGSRYADIRGIAEGVFPEWCQDSPDMVHVLSARADIKLGCSRF